MPHVTTNPTISLGFTSSTTAASPWTYGKTSSSTSTGMTTPTPAPGLTGILGSGFGTTSGSSGTGAGVSKDVLKNLQDVVWSDDEVSRSFFAGVGSGFRTNRYLGISSGIYIQLADLSSCLSSTLFGILPFVLPSHRYLLRLGPRLMQSQPVMTAYLHRPTSLAPSNPF